MARRRKQSKWRQEVTYRASLLAGLAAMIGSFFIFESFEPTQQLMLSALSLVVAAFVTSLVLSRLLKPKAKPTTFDFDAPAPSKRQAATDFEYEVAGLIERLSGKRTEVVGGAGDGGIDIKVYDNTGATVGIVQCKRLKASNYVYPSYIHELNSVRQLHQVRIAYLVSTGRYSQESRALAKKFSIKLIDGEELKRLRQKAREK